MVLGSEGETVTAYYNEKDPYAAEWLRRLMLCSLIPWGDVDERSIEDVTPDDLRPYTQCHFFAGIGIWSLALQRAGWPDDRPVWTGSCPCQPFSAAGKGAGFDDERHLWPVWYQLVAQCRPPIILGEQVASKDGLNWLDLVSSDMEGAGYAVGASDLCAAGFGGAHIRQRLYFVGLAESYSRERERVTDSEGCERDGQAAGRHESNGSIEPSSPISGMADAGRSMLQPRKQYRSDGSTTSGVETEAQQLERGRVGNCDSGINDRSDGDGTRPHAPMLGRNLADWLYCRDGKWRPVEPGAFPLVVKAPARVGRLRAYGNGLDLETATGFVEAVMECAP